VARYLFRRGIRTVEDLLEAIGRRDIPSTRVVMRRMGDEVEVVFLDHELSAEDEEKLKGVMAGIGFGRLVAKEHGPPPRVPRRPRR